MIRELFSLEAEYSVLGALMIDESLFDEITAKLHISDFYDMECAALYSAIIETRAAGEPIDAVTVGIRHPLLPSGAGILAFAGNIAKNVPSASNWSVDAKFNDCALPKTSTGLADLDKLLGGGLRDKWMLVIAGRPGSGKTTIGLQIAQHATTRGGKVGLVFSLEMPEEELAMRSLASLGGVDLGRMDSGKMLDNDWPMLTNAVQQANEAELYICDKPGITVPQIRSICRQVQHKHGLDVVVIDYIGLIASAGKFGNRTEAVGAISTAIKNLSKELGVPVIVLAQLNRDVTKRKGGKPMASDLRDSGQIEQDADAVLLVHRDEETEEGRNGVTELILDKGRQMKKGSCLVQQQGNYARFVPFTGSRYDQGDDQW